MPRIVVVCLLLLVLYLPATAGTVGKLIVDPNAGRPRISEVTPSSADVTLKVTYEAKRKTVVSILADLSKITGVTLKAGHNIEDWQVRDRRMNIFAKDIPLINLMNSIARVMKFQWSKTDKDGAISYRLYMDRNVLLGAERQRYIEQGRLDKYRTDGRQRLLSMLEEAAEMSESELEELKTQSPYAYNMAKTGWAGLLPSLFAELPSAKQAWLGDQELILNINSLSPASQQRLMNMFPGVDGKIFGKGTFTINSSEYPGSGYGCVGNVVAKFDGPMYPSNFMDPENDMAKAMGKLWNAQMASEANGRADQSEMDRLRNALASTALKMKDPDEPLIEHPDDPALSAKVKMNVEGNDFADMLSTLAKSSSFAVVSDSFRRRFQDLSFPQGEIQVRAILDKLESACHYNWERHGSTLELHDRKWFEKRAAQIPDAWLEIWRRAFQDNGLLDIGELSQMAALTDDQYWGNVLEDQTLGSTELLVLILRNRDLLRLYSRLNKQQRASMFTHQGLSLDSVSSDQSSTIRALLRHCSVSQGDSENGLRLLAVRETHGKQVVYIFNITGSGKGVIGAGWKIACPVYSPPSKDSTLGEAEKKGPKQ